MHERSLGAVNRVMAVLVAGGLVGALVAGCGGQSRPGDPHGAARQLAPPGITPKIAAYQRSGRLICDPKAYGRDHFPSAKPAPRDARLLTKQQVLSRYAKHLRKGETVEAVRMTYAQLHAANPGLASATRILVNPRRVMWAIIWHYSPPIAYQPCLRGYCPAGAQDRTIRVSVSSMVIDALTGQMTDSCTGCEAVPLRSRS